MDMVDRAPFAPLPYDLVLGCVFPHLNVQDLGRLSQTNKTHYAYLLRDEAWAHIRRRCIEAVPLWAEHIFDAFPWDENYSSEKRHKGRLGKSTKRAWKTPRGGTRYALKTYVGKVRDARSVRALMNSCAAFVERSYGFSRYRFDFGAKLPLFSSRVSIAKVAAVAGIGILANPVQSYHGTVTNRTFFHLLIDSDQRPVMISARRSLYLEGNGVSHCDTSGFSRLFLVLIKSLRKWIK